MYGSLISMGLNVLLNWVLIFGKLGFAPMGVKGAAIATVVARIAESIVIVIYLYTKENNLHIRVRTLLQSDRTVLGPFFKTSAPIIINELFWAIGESVIAATMGQMGTEVVSANSICSVMNQMATVFVQGATAATCVIVGNTIGAGKLDELPRQKRFFQTFVLIMGTVAGLVIFFTGDFVISLYDVSAVTRQYASQMILITAVIQPFCAFQITNMMGILRGGGDVRFAMFNDLIFLWCVTIPLGFLGGVVWKLPVWLVFCLMRVEKVGKSITSELACTPENGSLCKTKARKKWRKQHEHLFGARSWRNQTDDRRGHGGGENPPQQAVQKRVSDAEGRGCGYSCKPRLTIIRQLGFRKRPLRSAWD